MHCGTLRLGNWHDKLLGYRSVDGDGKDGSLEIG